MIEFRKDLFADERNDDLNEIGKPTQRQDALGHVTGRSPYFDDHLFDGLLHLKCLRSPHHHARIRLIDVSQAERMPGVRRIIRGADVACNLNTLLSLLDFGDDDEPLLAEDVVRYVGEAIVAVVAESERQAFDAIAKIRVDYDVLPHVLDVEEAIKPGAPSVNPAYPENTFTYHERYDRQKLRFGDVERAFRQAEHIVEGRYQMSPIEQAPTETCGAIAAPETNDRYVCYTSTQALFFSLGTTSKLLNVPSNRLHFIGGTVGGGFGGKVDSLHEPLAILGCILTGRPVRYAYDRAEEMQVGAPRGGEVWYLKDGIMRDGRIVARKLTGYFDSGAYTRLSSYAIIKATGHLPGPYTIPNVQSDVFCVYTNRTPATAMRGFGITGVDFAIESHMDKSAHEIGMNPIEYRILNAYRDGDMKAHRREAKNCALIECCQVAAEKAGWAIGDQYRAMASMRDGGGPRAEIPQTPIDQDGLRSPGPARQSGYQAPRTTPSYQPLQPSVPAPSRPVAPPPVTSTPPAPAPVSPQPAVPAPTAPPTAVQPAPPPPQAEPRFQQGVKRPGVNRFSSISGTRRR